MKKRNSRIFILLHGYMQDGFFMEKQLEDYLPDNADIISINAPYLVKNAKQEDKYTWYFFEDGKYTVNYDLALKTIIDKYSEYDASAPVTIVGYSQGGYLAPAVGELIESCDSIIGLACNFKTQYFKVRKEVQYTQIHGVKDSVVEFESMNDEFTKLSLQTENCELISLENSRHKLDQSFKDTLKAVISNL